MAVRSASSSAPNQPFLYHYTSRRALYDVLRTCVLRPSHAAWGFGVYLTDIAPLSTNRRQISLVFGTHRFYAERLEAYVRIGRQKANAESLPDDPRVFIAHGKVSIAGEPVEIGIWQGSDEPDDSAGWKTDVFGRCAPDLAELRAVFQRSTPND